MALTKHQVLKIKIDQVRELLEDCNIAFKNQKIIEKLQDEIDYILLEDNRDWDALYEL